MHANHINAGHDIVGLTAGRIFFLINSSRLYTAFIPSSTGMGFHRLEEISPIYLKWAWTVKSIFDLPDAVHAFNEGIQQSAFINVDRISSLVSKIYCTMRWKAFKNNFRCSRKVSSKIPLICERSAHKDSSTCWRRHGFYNGVDGLI